MINLSNCAGCNKEFSVGDKVIDVNMSEFVAHKVGKEALICSKKRLQSIFYCGDCGDKFELKKWICLLCDHRWILTPSDVKQILGIEAGIPECPQCGQPISPVEEKGRRYG